MRTVLLVGILAACACADTLELKTGERLQGTFKQATSAGVVIETAGQPITMPLDKVRAIYFGSPPKAVEAVSLINDSMLALKALRSVTTSGVTMRDYNPRVLEARVKVDQYLSSHGQGDEKPRVAISRTMRYYELASSVWLLNVTPVSAWSSEMFRMEEGVGQALRSEKELAICPFVANVLTESDAENARNAEARRIQTLKNPRARNLLFMPDANHDSLPMNIVLRLPAPVLWVCASTSVAEAEHLVAQVAEK